MYSHTLFFPQQAIIPTFPERMHYEAGVDCSGWSWGREHHVFPINLLLSCFCMALFGRMYHLRIVWFIYISLNEGLLSGFLASKVEYHTLQALKILYMCAKPWKPQQLPFEAYRCFLHSGESRILRFDRDCMSHTAFSSQRRGSDPQLIMMHVTLPHA
jgi:hypothetical protein